MAATQVFKWRSIRLNKISRVAFLALNLYCREDRDVYYVYVLEPFKY